MTKKISLKGGGRDGGPVGEFIVRHDPVVDGMDDETVTLVNSDHAEVVVTNYLAECAAANRKPSFGLRIYDGEYNKDCIDKAQEIYNAFVNPQPGQSVPEAVDWEFDAKPDVQRGRYVDDIPDYEVDNTGVECEME